MKLTFNNKKGIINFSNGEINYLLKPDKYNFTYTSNEPLKYELKGLYGLYPFNNEPKYIKLSNFKKGFARFELPNGKKGWLDLDGKNI